MFSAKIILNNEAEKSQSSITRYFVFNLKILSYISRSSSYLAKRWRWNPLIWNATIIILCYQLLLYLTINEELFWELVFFVPIPWPCLCFLGFKIIPYYESSNGLSLCFQYQERVRFEISLWKAYLHLVRKFLKVYSNLYLAKSWGNISAANVFFFLFFFF